MPHTSARRRAVHRSLALGVAALAALAAAPSTPPKPLGIGDRLFPYLGNPGYDVLNYDIGLRYHGNDRPLDAVTTISARATAGLHRLNLDFTHGTVRSITVDGRRASFATADQDLVITPRSPLRSGDRFKVVVRHTSDPRGPARGGWVRTQDGLVMANQANAAHRVFPCNDHPSDKAGLTFRVTAPKDLTVVAGGHRLSRHRHGAQTTWVYRSGHPVATELAQLSIGRSTVVRHTGPGRVPLRDVVPTARRAELDPWLRRTPEQLSWLQHRLGRYPFENYGLLVAEASTGFELETQTLSLFEHDLFTTAKLPRWYVESVMLHELSHQWFGDSVSPRSWSDLWLNEGHASWYEALYAERVGGPSLEKRMRAAYGHSDAWRAQAGPPARLKAADPGHQVAIFQPVVYDGAALALYALRQEIGRPAFERLEREWVRRHRDGTAGTADFIRLASRTAGRDLSGFLRPWLYGTKTPPMPGHPDWKPTAEDTAAGTPKPE
ncbi:M1 family metallopeptidase [Streptomyces palmae]|uniref:Aminopeptidase N n=1 Tax=Streptomyces palmae TaxID=1701085 RepID=A0A4Z0H5Y0_9ACTN|nr:M1 family metallopeptidase [Streptomyces palmae]TGB07567.1 M1 family peptidase [Streptomyces palmae]